MFTDNDFEKLSALWDGKLANSSEVCGNCGACCSNIQKTLMPGEYEYAKKVTGQDNVLWCSPTCLCHSLNYKPVICKIFPMLITVNLDGYTLDENFAASFYSKNCAKLEATPEILVSIKEYLDFLFSDRDNKIFYMLTFHFSEFVAREKEYLKELGKTLPINEVQVRAMHSLFGLDLKNIFTHYRNIL